jgi:hypothetical protein
MLFQLQQGQLGRRRARPLWTMANLANPPAHWYNETSSVTGATNASQWNDTVGTAHMAQGTAAAQPLIVASGLNSKRTLRFDGSNDVMRASAPTFNQVGYAWLATVYKRSALDGGLVARGFYYTPTNAAVGNTRFGMWLALSTANRVACVMRRLDGDSSGSLQGATIADTNWHIALLRMEWANGDAYLYHDGGAPASNLTITTTGNTQNNNPVANSALGAQLDGAGNAVNFANVEIAELALHSGVANVIPTSDEIDKIFGSLAWKWGIQSILPGGHPYATSPPTV